MSSNLSRSDIGDPFRSPKRRIARAKHHIHDLEREISAFLSCDPWVRTIEPHADGLRKQYKFKLIHEIPDIIEDTSIEAMDCLRSALDQAGYAAAVAGGISDPKKSYFPFADSPADLANVIKGRCRDIPADVVSLMETFQPYRGGNDLLWAMNKARLGNQHKIITPTVINAGGMLGPGGGQYAIYQAYHLPRFDRSKNEVLVATVGPLDDIQYEIILKFDIAFDKIEVLAGKPVLAALNTLSSEVESIVMAIEAETRRLGLIH